MTDTSEEWGPWIEHDGEGCPLATGVFVVAQNLVGGMRVGCVGSCGGGGWRWVQPHPIASVVRYRIRKPRGLTILENLLQDIPAPEREGADA